MPQGTVDQRDRDTYAIIGAGMEVHRNMGAGFLEPVYHAALEKEFRGRGIPYQREYEIPVRYKGDLLGLTYRADFVCFGEVLVEVKALTRLTEAHAAQVINYLVATGIQRGMLLNFGSASLQYRRVVRSAAFCKRIGESASSAKSADGS